MTIPIIRIHDLATNEIIDREMNDDELAQWETDKAEQAAAVSSGVVQPKFVVVAILLLYQATIVALFQSKVGLIVFHASVIGTEFHLKA